MLIDITPEGASFLKRIEHKIDLESTPTDLKIDFIVLRRLQDGGPEELDDMVLGPTEIPKHITQAMKHYRRSSVRRLFENGYIEQVEE